jgi:hypothetical protein
LPFAYRCREFLRRPKKIRRTIYRDGKGRCAKENIIRMSLKEMDVDLGFN